MPGKTHEKAVGRGAQACSTPSDRGLIAASLRNATSLALLQLFGRAMAFTMNQYLLRYVTPSELGIAVVQMDLLLATVLSFSREGFRTALLRSTADSAPKLQAIINLSYIPTGIGVAVTAVSYMYFMLVNVFDDPIQSRNFRRCLVIYAVTAWAELWVEPIFLLAQVRNYFNLRVLLEGLATTTFCGVTLYTTVLDYDKRDEDKVGVAAFGFGRAAFTLVLLLGYSLFLVINQSSLFFGHEKRSSWWGILPKRLPHGILFDREMLRVASSLTKQAFVRHFLTEGDKVLLSILASRYAQGIYGFVFNYGSLVARTVYVSMEESFRIAFGRLMEDSELTQLIGEKRPNYQNEMQCLRLLRIFTRFHLLFGLLFISIGSVYTGPLIHLLAGAKWSLETDTPRALSAFCWLLPFLGLNGLLESFVAATAPPHVIAGQSKVLVVFFVAFATVGTVNLRFFKLGAVGLIVANVFNMALRIAWCAKHIYKFWTDRGFEFSARELLPRPASIGAYALAFAGCSWANWRYGYETWDMWATNVSFGVATGLGLLGFLAFSEKEFIGDLLLLATPARVATKTE